MTDSQAVPVTESSQVGEARRLATTLAARLGFDETGRGRVALVATEAATNLLKHARDGILIFRSLDRAGVGGLEVLALDMGPGIADVDRCLDDGYSTAGSPGNGLGALARLGDAFDIHSDPKSGTALVVRLWSTPCPAGAAHPGLEIGAVCLPIAGESASGDAWSSVERDGRWLVMVADGLGHGPQAADAAREAIRVFDDRAEAGPTEILQAAHDALRSTRGAVVAVAECDREQESIRFVGVGNIAASIQAAGAGRSLVSHNGIVGHKVHKLQEFRYPWPTGALLVMHSDGLATQWRLDLYPGLTIRDPGLVAGVLYRDFKRDRDDVTVVVARDAIGGEAS